MKGAAALGLLLVWMWVAGGCQARRDARIERFESLVDILPNGTLDVRESFTLRSQGVGTFERRIPPGQFDSISFVSVGVDNEPTVSNADVQDGEALRVRLPLSRAGDGTHRITLTYRAGAALFIQGRRGYLRWAALPEPSGSPIPTVHLELAGPFGRLTPSSVGIVESGWQVARTDRGITADRRQVSAAERATLVAEILIEPAQIAEPRWQYDMERSAELVPAFLSGAIFIVIIGAGVIWIMRWQYAERGATPSSSPVRPGQALDEYRRAARGLWIAGAVSTAFGSAIVPVMMLALTGFGWWPFSIPGSIVFVGIVFIAVGRTWERSPRRRP